MEAVFKESNLDVTFLSDAIAAADEYIYTDQALDFNGWVEQSFLPEIIRLCRENGIQLILVRMPIQRFQTPGSQPEELDAYINNLAAYLSDKDVPFLDFDQAKDFPNEYFEDTLHLNGKGREEFTRRLTESLAEIID